MDASLSREDVRALLARSGLSLPSDRLERMVPAIQAARESGRRLGAIEMGYIGPPAFRPPEYRGG